MNKYPRVGLSHPEGVQASCTVLKSSQATTVLFTVKIKLYNKQVSRPHMKTNITVGIYGAVKHPQAQTSYQKP